MSIEAAHALMPMLEHAAVSGVIRTGIYSAQAAGSTMQTHVRLS